MVVWCVVEGRGVGETWPKCHVLKNVFMNIILLLYICVYTSRSFNSLVPVIHRFVVKCDLRH